MFETHNDDGGVRDYAKEGKEGKAGTQGDDRLVMQAEKWFGARSCCSYSSFSSAGADA